MRTVARLAAIGVLLFAAYVLENREGLAILFQGPIFNAYVCEMTVDNGKVVRKQVTAMDD